MMDLKEVFRDYPTEAAVEEIPALGAPGKGKKTACSLRQR